MSWYFQGIEKDDLTIRQDQSLSCEKDCLRILVAGGCLASCDSKPPFITNRVDLYNPFTGKYIQ